tara:strand:- start:2239 stop:2445 length:207 start_codon:yes stop_codon:yes gene_type:complete
MVSKFKKTHLVKSDSRRELLKELKQVGKSDRGRDIKRIALASGKRVSNTGNVYWETRKNRSDAEGSNV